ncbi:MAG TPA: hypothetical protein VGE41_13205 [Verrucomicrobiae bacterium]
MCAKVKNLLLALLFLAGAFNATSQLVNDGATKVINGIHTNIVGLIDIGTNGPFTTLIITNAGTVSNTSAFTIGLNLFSSNNLVIVTGSGSILSAGNLNVGNAGSFNRLLVTNGAAVINSGARIGNSGMSTGNLAVITGTNSYWSNTSGILYIGNGGPTNRLVISNGGVVQSSQSALDGNTTSASPGGHYNSVLVTDPGSLWTMNADLFIAWAGSFDQFIITNGAVVQCGSSYVAGNPSGFISSNNLLVVTGTNSLWRCNVGLQFGSDGFDNRLLITNGGTLLAGSFLNGFNPSASNNSVVVDGGSFLVTNLSQMSRAEIRRGSLTLNSGLVATDLLVLTNGRQNQFTFNGGSFQSGQTTNSNGAVFAVGNGVSNAVFTLLRNGTHVFGNGLQISSNGALKGNGTIIGDVTNAPGGTLAPGPSSRRLNINGRLVLSPGSTNIFELFHSPLTNDNIAGLASVSYGGTLLLMNLSGTLSNGDNFKLFSAAAYSGNFDTLVPSSPGPGLKWNTSALPITGTLRVVSTNTPAPALTNLSLLNPTNLLINASGGIAYDPVFLLTSTNITLPAPNWIPVVTNFFDSTGNASFSFGLDPAEPQRYFRLSVQ